MSGTYPLDGLIQNFCKFPGIGYKSAQRLAFFILSMPLSEVERFSSVIVDTRRRIQYCSRCYNISFSPLCTICSGSNRNESLLCIVAQPRDILAIERSRSYQGVYHVLGGLISPIDGIYPESLRIQELLNRLSSTSFSEVIFAINPTIEGDATTLYLTKVLERFGILLSKLAYGLPVGSDMDYADELTLQKAILGRSAV